MKLDDRQKAWLVTAWACYKRGPELMRDFVEEFGQPITRGQAHRYDCSGVKDEEEAKKRGLMKWLPLFREARKRFDDSVVDIPIANKAYRIRMLDAMFDHAYGKKNFKSAAQLLEQAAKETGGLFTSARQVDTTLTGKLEVEHEIPEEIRDASLAENLSTAIVEALAQSQAGTPQTIQ